MKHFYTDPNGVTHEWETPDPPQAPLDQPAVIAALLAATGVLSLDDAANAVGQTPAALVAEVQAWAVAQDAGE